MSSLKSEIVFLILFEHKHQYLTTIDAPQRVVGVLVYHLPLVNGSPITYYDDEGVVRAHKHKFLATKLTIYLFGKSANSFDYACEPL